MRLEDPTMATIEKPCTESDLEEVYRLLALGKSVTDPELIRRIRERSAAARRAVFERNGLLDVAVPSIRSLRDGAEE
jgi:hypothetical protein